MPADRTSRRRSAGPALVALLVGAIAAGAASLSLAQPAAPMPGTRGPQPDLPIAAALAEHGSVRDAPGGSAPSTTASPSTTTPSSAAPSTTSAPPSPASPPPPPPPPATTPRPTTPAPTDDSQRERVVTYVNAVRAEAGCDRPVTVDQRLVNAAQAHSTDMATRRYFSHTSPEGQTFVDRSRAAGYPRPAAENIARGQRSAESVMRDWLESDGHRRNILNCEYRTIGVGLDTRGWYWTQVFGR